MYGALSNFQTLLTADLSSSCRRSQGQRAGLSGICTHPYNTNNGARQLAASTLLGKEPVESVQGAPECYAGDCWAEQFTKHVRENVSAERFSCVRTFDYRLVLEAPCR